MAKSKMFIEETAYIDGSELIISRPAKDSRLRCEIKNRFCVPEAKLYRCFPLSEREDFVSICSSDGNEVAIIRGLKNMEQNSRLLLEGELDKRYFTPVIEKIYDLRQDASMWIWDVATQRGRVNFYIRGVRDSVHEVAPRRWQILSMDGQRYEIRDFELLDTRSKSLFESLF